MARTKKPCNVPGCPILVSGRPRCTEHQREWERARGTHTQRGYDAKHEALRVRLLPTAYGQLCSRCGERMLPGQMLHLDHEDDRKGYRGFSHQRCNNSAGGTAAHREIS